MTHATERAYIGLGSNLGDPAARVRSAMEELRALATGTLHCSSLYRTAPVGLTEQPDFVNAVCACETALAPDALMRELLAIERRNGRVRDGAAGGPRTLDLDLLLYGERMIDTPFVSLPHPRLHERAFVLYPLTELDPELVVPGRGPVRALLRHCASQTIERLNP